MRRRRKPVTRRRKAIRWLVILALVLAYITIPGRFHFLPSQAIRDAERLGNIGPTELLYAFPGQEGRMLRVNDKGLMICTLENNVLSWGWEADYCGFLDCTKPAPFHVGFCKSFRWANWYGRVDDPVTATVRLEFYEIRNGEKKELYEAFTIEKEDWLQWGGHLYFAVEFPKETWTQYNLLHSELLDQEGNLLDSREVFLDRIDRRGNDWNEAVHE